MNIEQVLKTAHIHLESATFRVHVEDERLYDTNAMSDADDKPKYIMWVSKSHDYTQKKSSILIEVVGGEWNLEEMASWIKKHEIQKQ